MNVNTLKSIARHMWLDADDTRKALPPEALRRLTARIAGSERQHTGQIVLCIEAALPPGEIWRLGRAGMPMRQMVQERALGTFSKLRVWDTERNNGVLVFLLLAEQAIEIVADRGVAAHVPQAHWDELIARMSATFRERRFEDGLSEALDAVSHLLVAYFPARPGQQQPLNELPDAPVLA